jgi:polyisoprenoid-binding protein YceI
MSKISLILVLLFGIFAGTSAQSNLANLAKLAEAIKDESSVTYRLSHLLHTIEAVSKDVAYRTEIDPSKKEIKTVTAQVDVTTFDSGNSNRDSHAMEVIDAITYPTAAFSSKSISQNGDSLTVAGKLTFHGITKDVVMLGTAVWSPNKLEVQGAFTISLTAFQIERPSLLMVPVNDDLKFTLKASFSL